MTHPFRCVKEAEVLGNAMRKVFDDYKPNPAEWLKYVMRWVQGFAALDLEF